VADTLQHVFSTENMSAALNGASSYTARKVGRNEVWEITGCGPAGGRSYAKWWPSPEMFQRELEGLRIVNSLATRHSWLMATTVIVADEATGVIVVRELCGVSGEELISRPLRRLRPAMNRAAQKRGAVRCLSMIVQFLEHLHRVPVQDSAHLTTHGPTAVVARVNELAERLRQHPLLEGEIWNAFPLCLRDFPIADVPRDCVLHGDPSPGNFIVDDSRLGVLDFEDLGVGPACRDLLWVDYCLEQYDRMWHYGSGEQLRRVISHIPMDPGVRLLYRLEFLLLHLIAIVMRPVGRPMLARYSDRLERLHVVRSLRRHCDLVFHRHTRLKLGESAYSH
jgi:hypothetical protein